MTATQNQHNNVSTTTERVVSDLPVVLARNPIERYGPTNASRSREGRRVTLDLALPTTHPRIHLRYS